MKSLITSSSPKYNFCVEIRKICRLFFMIHIRPNLRYTQFGIFSKYSYNKFFYNSIFHLFDQQQSQFRRLWSYLFRKCIFAIS